MNQEKFEILIQTYKGDDPLQPRYEYVAWVEQNLPVHESANSLVPLLESIIATFKDNELYKKDGRFVELVLKYITFSRNPLNLFENVCSQGIGTMNTLLYKAWAEELCRSRDFTTANQVYLLGISNNAQPLEALKNLHLEFLAEVGRLYLNGDISKDVKPKPCPHCPHCQGESSNQRKPEGRSTQFAPKVSDPDDFVCPMAVFEPPDPSKIPMYPKNKVYNGDVELQLEEIRAEIYNKRYEMKAAEKARQEEEMLAKKKADEERKNAPKAPVIDKTPDTGKSLLPVEMASLPKPIMPRPLFPQLFQDQNLSLANQQSFTVNTKEAMNVVQGMWSSPAPVVVPTKKVHLEKNPNPPPPTDENTPNPLVGKVFGVYSDDFAEPQGPAPKLNSVAKGLSERKLPLMLRDEPETRPHAKQHLFFSDKDHPPSSTNESVLSQFLAQELLPNSNAPEVPCQMPFPGGLSCKLQEHDRDLSDETCNTKAFAFVLPSSTPHSKSRALRNNEQEESYIAPPFQTKPGAMVGNSGQGMINGNTVQQNGTKVIEGSQPQQSLSMILEASVEKYNSSSGSSAHSTKTPGSSMKRNSVRDLLYGMKNLLTSDGNIDPFSNQLKEYFLTELKFPHGYKLENYNCFNTTVPNLGKSVKIENETYSISGDLGKGNYARVVKAILGNKIYAFKVEKPACLWEYYICNEVQSRVPPEKAILFMSTDAAFFYSNGSILRTEWAAYGTLLDLVNHSRIKTGKTFEMVISLYLTVQIVDCMYYLHQANIIHGDVKPDNFVLRTLPTLDVNEPCVQLIDFGRSIDMTLFPNGTKFTTIVTTDGFQCNEMKENRPWTYQSDLYGVAGTVYCMLIGDYMKVVKKNNVWTLQKALPRYLKREVWDSVFRDLLNVESCDVQPNLLAMRTHLANSLNDMKGTFKSSYSSFKAMLLGKK